MGNDKTRWIFDDDDKGGDPGGASDFTESLGPPAFADQGRHADPTRLVRTTEKTTLAHGGNLDKIKQQHAFGDNIDPVVGWLVVVKGPGVGSCVNLGVGVNSIGRDEGERAALPFGDTLISSKDHARVFYDDDARAFFIGHGTGKNITRMNGAIVANPMPMENYALIQLTKVTHLRFVAFCNEQFDWADLDRPAEV